MAFWPDKKTTDLKIFIVYDVKKEATYTKVILK